MKFVRLTKLHNGKHKYLAVFNDRGTPIYTPFGAIKKNGEPYDDYTITGDKDQRDRYRARHKKDLDTNDPTRAGYLSYYLLWGDSTNINVNLANYINRFNL
jgi:hypothetical protein